MKQERKTIGRDSNKAEDGVAGEHYDLVISPTRWNLVVYKNGHWEWVWETFEPHVD
jgi:hypothetical protein